jgi:flavin reductase (DIM6/NTAB) family NADH-FMN oxidoreductase RutF
MPTDDIAKIIERIDQELWIVTAAHEGRQGGLVATFVSPASIVPDMPRIIVGLDKRHETWRLIEGSNAFAVHLIDESQLDLVWRFGLQCSRDADKFAGLTVKTSATGSPVLSDAPAWLECRVESRFDTGDRTIYLAAVIDGANVGGTPLTTKRLAQIAPRDKLAVMRSQLAEDVRHDREAILKWRTK